MIVSLLRGYLVLALAGWALLPWLRPLLRNLPDGGYAASRCLGPAVAAWAAFLYADLAGAPLDRATALGAPLVVLAIGLGIRMLVCRRAARARPGIEPAPGGRLRGELRSAAWVEAIGLSGAVLFGWLAAHNPAIDPDSERFMDYAFLNAALKSPGLPVEDPWLSGEPINYYSFGYLVVAWAARGAGLGPERIFVPSVALVHALTWMGAYGIGLALSGRRRGGVIAALLVLGAGNFEWIRQALQGAGTGSFDWFSPARTIAGGITEFPWFSLLWGDLHPYILVLPIVLAALAVGISAALAASDPAGTPATATAGRAALFALACGALMAAHPWDVPPTLLAAALAIACGAGAGRRRMAPGFLAAGVAGLLPFAPFLQGLRQQGRSLGWVEHRSSILEWSMAFGPFVLLGLIGAALLARPGAAAMGRRPEGVARERIALAFGGTALLAALACEMFYLRDLFAATGMARSNTIFKLHRAAWVLLGVSAPVLIERLPIRTWGAKAALVLVAAASAVYPLAGTAAWLRWRAAAAAAPAGAQASGSAGDTLFRALFPGDAAAADHLRLAARPGEAVLEETGEAYSWSARIATFSGVPAVLGWGNHEAVWRNDWGPVLERQREVRRMYADPASTRGQDLLRAHRVAWVVVGERERRRYGEGIGAGFEALGRKVVDTGGTALYHLAPVVAVP